MNAQAAFLKPQEHADRLAESLRLAVEIADEAARSDIESWGVPLADRWFDIAPHDGDDDYERATLIRAAKYLTLRGQLEVDPADVLKVRVKA